MTQGSDLVTELINRDIRVHILNVGVMDNTPASKLIRNIFFAFTEFERDMIVERTQEGKAIARTKVGYKEGRSKMYTDIQLNMGVELLKENSCAEVEKMTKISKSALIRALRKKKLHE